MAYQEAERVRAAMRPPAKSISDSDNVQSAIEGAEALHRWAKEAAEHAVARVTEMQADFARLGMGQARHKGDVGLNQYIAIVVQECWCGVWEGRVADGPKLWRFVIEAAAAIDERLSEDASRERIRRIFSLRRANRRAPTHDLPNLEAIEK
jgi:hypothetical protein